MKKIVYGLILLILINNFCLANTNKSDDIDRIINSLANSESEDTGITGLNYLIKHFDQTIDLINNKYKNKKSNIFDSLKWAIINKNYHNDRELIAFVNKASVKNQKDFAELFNKTTLTNVFASSTLKDKNNDYAAKNVLDGNPQTAWAEGIAGNGVGEWLEINFQTYRPEANLISKLNIINGYGKNKTTFIQNNRVKTIKLTFENSSTLILELKDTMELQTIDFPETTTQKVKLEILEIYQGSKYQDTCISELYFTN